jgi:hypothetical protein
MKHPRYEDFRFAPESIVPDEAVMQSVEDRTHGWYLTGDGFEDGTPQRISVCVTSPAEARETNTVVVRPGPWSDDFLRPDGAVFDGVLAQATGAYIVSVNTPGVEYKWPGSTVDPRQMRQTPEQIADLNAGSFRSIGAAAINAVHGCLLENGLQHNKRIIHSSSMAAATAAGMVRRDIETGRQIDGLVFAETVNTRRRSLGRMGYLFAEQGKYASGYIEQNPEILQDNLESTGFWLQRVVHDGGANLRLARAMGRDGFYRDMGDTSVLARTDMNTAVRIEHGSASRLSPSEEFARLLGHFNPDSFNAQSVEHQGHDHPYTMTAEYIRQAVADIEARW